MQLPALNIPGPKPSPRYRKDLQNGNISAAQKDYANIQQDFQQQQRGTSQVHHHHHRGGGQQSNEISQALNSLSATLKSNNLSSAHPPFATLQQDLQQFESGSLGSTTGGRPSHAQPAGGTLRHRVI